MTAALKQGHNRKNLISLIIPTYNEAKNITQLVQRIAAAVKQPLEMVIVDDNSPDGTGAIADALAKKYPIRVIHRPGKLGFASAVIDGLRHARGNIIGYIDADLSHPPELLPQLLRALDNGADIAVGSRRVGNGKTTGWPLLRHAISLGATLIASPLTRVKDRTSGYFVFKRNILHGKKLDLIGYKIMLEVVVRSGSKRVVEVPFTFVNRTAGKSKTNLKICWLYVRHLARLYRYKFFG